MSRAVVDAKEFSHAMSKISKILKKCAIPILEEVCLRIQNGRCTLTATDLETWLTAELPASGDDMFFVFRKTKDILRACSHFAGELTMEFSETRSGSKKAGKILLRCERRGAEFEVYDGADYPNMPQAPEGDAFSVSSARLSACVERVRYAAEKPSVSARPAAICVQFCGNRVYALDGTRLACDTLEGVSFPKPFLVRADVLAHLSAFGKEDMTVRIGSSHVLFASGNLRMLARLQGVDTYTVKRATTIAPPDSPLDVLKGVLLESDSARKMLTVTSTNLEVALVEKIPCSAQEDGALVYSARTLAEMLQRLPEDTVEISRKENRGRMTLTSGSVSYEVDVWDRGAFPKPDLPFPEDTVKVSGIPAVAQHTVFATAQDKDKPLLRCVNLMFTDAGLRAAGSNGMCIVTAKGDDQSTGDISLLVPALSLGKLAGMCKDEDEFRVGTTGKSIVFFKENFLFSARLMEGGYIDTNSLLKTITNSFTVLTDTKEMREALSSVLSVALDGRVNLAFEDQKLVFHCSSDWGNASAGIDVIALTGAPTGSYWYSAKQLATCLKALGGTITLGIAQGGMLTISTQDAYYLQNVMRAPTAKKKSKKAIEPPAAKAA